MTMILLLVAIFFALLVLVRVIEFIIHLMRPKSKPPILEGDTTVYVQITPKASVNSDKEGQ